MALVAAGFLRAHVSRLVSAAAATTKASAATMVTKNFMLAVRVDHWDAEDCPG